MTGVRALLAAVILTGAAGFCAPDAAADATLKIGGTGSALGSAQRLLDGLTTRNPGISGAILPSLGTSGGIKALAAGTIDIALASRPLKQAEADMGLVAKAYGTTALVFAVPLGNPRGGIRGMEVVDIYAERTKAWGDGTPIRFVLRPPSDTDTDILMHFLPMLETPWKRAAERRIVPVAYTDQEAADLVETMPGGFGPNTLSLILAEKRPLKALSLDGVSPTIENIRDGTYDLTKTFYFITRSKAEAAVDAFLDFAFSPAGRAILEEIGIAPPKDGT